MGGNHRAGWQDRVVRCCCASRRPTHSLSPGSPDAFNPPGCCWRCRRRCFLSAGSRALSRTSGAGRGGSHSRVESLTSRIQVTAVCVSIPPPEQQPHWRASLLRSAPLSAAAVSAPPAGCAGGALQLPAEAEGAAGKVCQGGCSQ